MAAMAAAAISMAKRKTAPALASPTIMRRWEAIRTFVVSTQEPLANHRIDGQLVRRCMAAGKSKSCLFPHLSRDWAKAPWNRTSERGVATASSENMTLMYPMLNDNNYGAWAVRMKILMRTSGTWEAIEGTGPVSEKVDQGALAVICQAVPDDVMMSIVEKQTAKEAWEALREMHVGEGRVKAANRLKRELDMMKMEETETINEFALRLTNTVSEIRALGSEILESTVVEKLFHSVPDQFLPIVDIIRQRSDISEMSSAEVIGHLKIFEATLKKRQQENGRKKDGKESWESIMDKAVQICLGLMFLSVASMFVLLTLLLFGQLVSGGLK